MHHLFLITIILWLANIADECRGNPSETFVPLQSGLRLRFGDDIFQQLSRIVGHLFKKHVKQMVVPTQQQCFPEGCVRIQNFQLIAHQNPSYVVVLPTPPNLLTLRISDFSFYMAGTLYGQIQPLLLLPMTIPTFGTLAISANQLVIEAIFDIQKTVHNVPYIRLISCSLINEVILAWVENMGLFTILVNSKYQHEITIKTRQVLEETLCITLNNAVNNDLNNELHQIPNQISIFDLYQMFFKKSGNLTDQKTRRALESLFNYQPVLLQPKMQTSDRDMLQESQLNKWSRFFSVFPYTSKMESEVRNSSSILPAIEKSNTNRSPKNSLKKLVLLILSLSILDTSATNERFFIGLDGDVNIRSFKNQIKNPYQRPKILRFTGSMNGNAVDLLISEYTINTLLLKAHIIGALVFGVSSATPILGKLIRTSCEMDEVCLSDIIPEVAETYPNKQLEIVVQVTEPPKAIISTGTAIVTLIGRAIFFIEGTTEKIAVIPFSTIILSNVTSLSGHITGLIKIKTLQFDEPIDFFGLSLQSLNSFKEAAKSSVMKLINGILQEGINLNDSSTLPLSNITISLVDGAILLQTNLNIERIFYQHMPLISV